MWGTASETKKARCSWTTTPAIASPWWTASWWWAAPAGSFRGIAPRRCSALLFNRSTHQRPAQGTGVGVRSSGRLDAVPALSLGGIECAVGAADQSFEGFTRTVLRHPDTDGHADVVATEAHPVLLDEGAQCLGPLAGILQGAVLEEQHEFLATPTAQAVALADLLADQRRHPRDHRVAPLVAKAVVDRLEVIQIDGHQGQGLVTAPR